jgi:hypothetical protein
MKKFINNAVTGDREGRYESLNQIRQKTGAPYRVNFFRFKRVIKP